MIEHKLTGQVQVYPIGPNEDGAKSFVVVTGPSDIFKIEMDKDLAKAVAYDLTTPNEELGEKREQEARTVRANLLLAGGDAAAAVPRGTLAGVKR
jgi:hypothetical protein